MQAPSSYYHKEGSEGRHVYNCAYCEWTRIYPPELADHRRRAMEAVGAHIKKCHPGATDSVSEEADFATGFEKLVAAALNRGVEPSDVLSMIASGYDGTAAGFGLSLDQSLDVVRSWWPSEDEKAASVADKRKS